MLSARSVGQKNGQAKARFSLRRNDCTHSREGEHQVFFKTIVTSIRARPSAVSPDTTRTTRGLWAVLNFFISLPTVAKVQAQLGRPIRRQLREELNGKSW